MGLFLGCEMAKEPDNTFDLRKALGAKEASSLQRFSIYLPNRDRRNQPVSNIQTWIAVGLEILVDINGGATCLPPAQGRFKVVEEGQADVINVEDTVVVYSYIFDFGTFVARFPEIKVFVHSFGQATNQKSVMAEFLGEKPSGGSYSRAYYITEYPAAI